MLASWLVGGSKAWTSAVLVLLTWSFVGCTAPAQTREAAPVGSSTRRTADSRPSAATSLAAVPARRTGAARPEIPTAATLPSGTTVPIRAVGTRANGQLAVPHDIRLAGWWRGGSRIGDPFGATLVAAHIDSFTQGLGPYAELLSVRPGQRVVMTSAHLRQAFSISSLRLVPRRGSTLPRWIFEARGQRRLTLVTCAGPYDASHGGYQNLAVVTALPTTDPVRRTAP